MKLVKKANLDNYKFAYGHFRKNRSFLEMILKMEIRDVLEISKHDFEGNYHDPSPVLSSVRKYFEKHKLNGKFSLRKLEDGEHWLIIRVK